MLVALNLDTKIWQCLWHESKVSTDTFLSEKKMHLLGSSDVGIKIICLHLFVENTANMHLSWFKYFCMVWTTVVLKMPPCFHPVLSQDHLTILPVRLLFRNLVQISAKLFFFSKEILRSEKTRKFLKTHLLSFLVSKMYCSLLTWSKKSKPLVFYLFAHYSMQACLLAIWAP